MRFRLSEMLWLNAILCLIAAHAAILWPYRQMLFSFFEEIIP
jgi:hypothetical protein